MEIYFDEKYNLVFDTGKFKLLIDNKGKIIASKNFNGKSIYHK